MYSITNMFGLDLSAETRAPKITFSLRAEIILVSDSPMIVGETPDLGDGG